MNFQTKLKESRIRKGFSQSRVADQLGVSQSNYSKYERGDTELPSDLLEHIVIVMEEPVLRREYAVERKLTLFNLPLLDNIDDSFSTVIDALIEELGEAREHACIVKKLARNKRCREDFSDKEWQQFFISQLQVADLMMALDLNFIKANERFRLDLNLVEKELMMKYRKKHYYLPR